MQRNVLEYLEETVKRVPDKIAFANDKTQLTFQQFSDDIRAIGSELIRKGYQKEPVLIYMNKSPEALEGFFGVIESGCFYVPLDEEMPKRRIELIIENTKARVIICDQENLKRVKELPFDGEIMLHEELAKKREDKEKLDKVRRTALDTDPLYVLFMGLLALSLVLLITVVVLGFKLKSARSDLAAAQTKIEQLRGGSQTGEDGQTVTGEDGSITGENDVGDPTQGDNTTGNNQTGGDTIDWLDLTGHDEVSVKPSTVYDKYYIYYTTGGVNLRSGPGTSYDKVTTVSLGSEVQAAAKQDGWTFVSVDGKFGWINSDFLSTTRPAS